MKYAIQRRGIFLAPPLDHDLDWLFRQFDDPAIWQMFGYDRSGRMKVLRAFRLRLLVVGILHTIDPIRRIGFVTMFPPVPDRGADYWEFGYAIPEAADRDAFSALSATDAMAHYMFEHLGVEAMGWRTRSDNKAADAVVRRLGYQPGNSVMIDDHSYTFYRLTQDGWKKRRARLDRGEASHPSGIGATFLKLEGPPFVPVVPKAGSGGSSD